MIRGDDAVSVDYKNNILSSEDASLGLPFAVETSSHSRSKRQKISGWQSVEFGRVSHGVEMNHWLVRVYDRMGGVLSVVRAGGACSRRVWSVRV